MKRASSRDLILNVISGGESVVVPTPAPGSCSTQKTKHGYIKRCLDSIGREQVTVDSPKYTLIATELGFGKKFIDPAFVQTFQEIKWKKAGKDDAEDMLSSLIDFYADRRYGLQFDDVQIERGAKWGELSLYQKQAANKAISFANSFFKIAMKLATFPGKKAGLEKTITDKASALIKEAAISVFLFKPSAQIAADAGAAADEFTLESGGGASQIIGLDIGSPYNDIVRLFSLLRGAMNQRSMAKAVLDAYKKFTGSPTSMRGLGIQSENVWPRLLILGAGLFFIFRKKK